MGARGRSDCEKAFVPKSSGRKGANVVKSTVFFASLAFLVAGTISLFGQTTAGGQHGSNEKTIEQLYLTSTSLSVLQQEVQSTNRDSQLLALSSIRNMMDEGKIPGGNRAVTADLLSDLAFDGTIRPVISNNAVINDFPEVRREACGLLGRLGGEQAVRSLLRVLETDPEPMVLSEAAFALGRIGLNPNNEVSHAIAIAVMRQTAVKPDNNFAFACLLAFQKLAKANKGLSDPDAFRAVLAIENGEYIPEVRQEAAAVLNILKSYS